MVKTLALQEVLDSDPAAVNLAQPSPELDNHWTTGKIFSSARHSFALSAIAEFGIGHTRCGMWLVMLELDILKIYVIY